MIASERKEIATVLKGIYGILGIQWWILTDMNPDKKNVYQ